MEKNLIGYFLEANLEQSDELHKFHNDYPLAPENLAVSSDMLSNYCKKVADKFEINVGYAKKLNPNLDNKTNCSLQKSSDVFDIRNETD